MGLSASLIILAALSPDRDRLPSLGTNLAPLAPGTTQWAFRDLAPILRPQDTADGDRVLVAEGRFPAGEYTVAWEGEGSVEVEADGTRRVLAGGRGTVPSSGRGLTLRLGAGTEGVRGLQLLMPGHGGIFHPVFLQRMSLYRSIRFCSWRPGRDSAGLNPGWWERTVGRLRPGEEQVVALANEKVSHPWLPIHAQTDDEARTLGSRLARSLKPNLTVIVEHGARPPEDPSGDQAYVREARATVGAFAEGFADNGRVVRVLLVPFDDPDRSRRMLEWGEGAFDGIAVEPTFGPALGDDDLRARLLDVGLGAVFEALTAEIDGPIARRIAEFAELARERGLFLLAASGGAVLRTSDPELAELFAEAVQDSRMGVAMERLLRAWRSAGGSLFAHARDCGPYRPSEGVVSALQYQDQDVLDAPIHGALVKYGLFPERFSNAPGGG